MNVLETAIYDKLRTGTALTALLGGTTSVYNQTVPASETGGCVVFTPSGGGDDNLCPSRSKSLLYDIKAVSATSPAAAGLIDAQIDARLHRATLTVTGWQNILLRREGDFAYTETTPEGARWYHNGGRYRIRLWQS